jgi:acetyl-CoA synthetase (ADP-forming)
MQLTSSFYFCYLRIFQRYSKEPFIQIDQVTVIELMNVIRQAIKQGRSALSEFESKQVLAAYQIPITREKLVHDVAALLRASHEIGYPVVLKGCSSDSSHKTESELIHLDIRNDDEAQLAHDQILGRMGAKNGAVLVQEMIDGKRELAIGFTRDAQLGPCVMFGLGGIFAEVLNDTAFRVAPIDTQDALEMMSEIKGNQILESIRGMPPVDKKSLAEMLIAVGRIGLEQDVIKEIDVNPVMISGRQPVAADALVILET